MKTHKLLLLFIITLFISVPLKTFAQLDFSGTDNYDGNENYEFLNWDTFTGFLEYDDCGKNIQTKNGLPSMERTGCPTGYNFTITDFDQINKIPFSKTSLKPGDFCQQNQCKLFLNLGESSQYNTRENMQLQEYISKGINTPIKLTLTDLSIGSYSSARFILPKISIPENSPQNNSPKNLVLLLQKVFSFFNVPTIKSELQ